MLFCSYIGCKYYSKMYDNVDISRDKQKTVFKWFVEAKGAAFLCVMTCLGSGLDIPGITAVMHVGLSDNMLEMLQTSGLGGRKVFVVSLFSFQ
jgi:superfamily II DNA helicase RecQ